MSNVKIFFSRVPGDRVKVQRQKLKLTQAQAAEACGVERETWSRYESNKIEMSAEVFRKFMDIGADADYLTTGIAKEVFEATIAAAGGAPELYVRLSPRQKALLDNYDALSEEGKRNVEDTLTLLTKPNIKKGR